MLNARKPVEAALRPDSPKWRDFLRDIDGFVELQCADPREGYRRLKQFAEAQLARLDAVVTSSHTDLKGEIMPETSEHPNALAAPPPILSELLGELLALVVDEPATWLATPSAQLGGRKPGDLIGTDEEFKVVSLLQAVDQGLF